LLSSFVGGDFLVKIINTSGDEEKFDSKDIKKELEAAGLPERVATELSERVEDRVQDRWTTAQVWQEVNVEMKRLEGEMQRAENNLNARSGQMRTEPRTETTMREDVNRMRTDTDTSRGRSETFIPESERERHQDNRY
jgi:hypothetical protein